MEIRTKTRLPSDVQARTTRECMHLLTRGHFWSRDKDGSHTIRSAVPEYAMLRASIRTIRTYLIEQELLPIEVLHCGNRNFRPFWFLWPWPWPYDLHIRTWPYSPWRYAACTNMNFLRQCCQKLSSERQTYTCRQTYIQDQNYTQRRFAGGLLLLFSELNKT